MEKLISKLLYVSNVFTVSENDLNLQLLSHSEYPSLKAITDTLDYFGIENLAAHVPTAALEQMPNTFLGLVPDKNQFDELLLVKKKNNRITTLDQSGKKQKLSLDAFAEIWTGTIIAIEKEEKGRRPILQRFNPISLATVLIIALAVFLISFKTGTQYVLHTLATLVGLGLSAMILKQALGFKDNLSAKVCGAISNKRDGCSEVIQDNSGKLFKNFGLAEASISYFFSFLLIASFLGINHSFFYAISIASLGVIILSLYLQAFVIKEWCVLCLGVSATLITQFAVLQYHFNGWKFDWAYILTALLIVALATFATIQLKKLWKRTDALEQTKTEFYTFKRTEAFFLQSLKRSPKVSLHSIDNPFRIQFGAKNAPIKITAVTNPLCGFCQEPFLTYNSLLKQYSESINVELIFVVPEDSENKSNQIVTTFLELFSKDNKHAWQALLEWYIDKDIDAWQKKYGTGSLSMALFPEKVISAHNQWAELNAIQYTPETLIKGRKFPKKEYNLDDIHFFIEALQKPVEEHQILTA